MLQDIKQPKCDPVTWQVGHIPWFRRGGSKPCSPNHLLRGLGVLFSKPCCPNTCGGSRTHSISAQLLFILCHSFKTGLNLPDLCWYHHDQIVLHPCLQPPTIPCTFPTGCNSLENIAFHCNIANLDATAMCVVPEHSIYTFGYAPPALIFLADSFELIKCFCV